MSTSMQHQTEARVSPQAQMTDQGSGAVQLIDPDEIERIYEVAFRDGLMNAAEGITLEHYDAWRRQCRETEKTCPDWCTNHHHSRLHSKNPDPGTAGTA